MLDVGDFEVVFLFPSACRPLAVTTCLSRLHRALGVIIADSLEHLLRRSPSVFPWLKLVRLRLIWRFFVFKLPTLYVSHQLG